LTRTIEASDPFDICGVLGYWALFAFCTHVMFARTLPIPWGAVVVISCAPVFLAAAKWPHSPLYHRFDTRDKGGKGGMLAGEDVEPMIPPKDSEPPNREPVEYGTFQTKRMPLVHEHRGERA
jgi:hypothetical protein